MISVMLNYCRRRETDMKSACLWPATSSAMPLCMCSTREPEKRCVWLSFSQMGMSQAQIYKTMIPIVAVWFLTDLWVLSLIHLCLWMWSFVSSLQTFSPGSDLVSTACWWLDRRLRFSCNLDIFSVGQSAWLGVLFYIAVLSLTTSPEKFSLSPGRIQVCSHNMYQTEHSVRTRSTMTSGTAGRQLSSCGRKRNDECELYSCCLRKLHLPFCFPFSLRNWTVCKSVWHRLQRRGKN